jgi:hypothetical protein
MGGTAAVGRMSSGASMVMRHVIQIE